MFELTDNLLRAGMGIGAGIAIGFVARRGRFCTLSAIEDAVYAKDTRRLRSWALAIAVAIIGTLLLRQYFELDLSRTIYVGPRLEWGGALIGGLAFGIGMALVGTCGFGTLLRLGGGDLKSFVTFLVLGISAFMAMRGLTGLARIQLLDPLSLDLAPRASQTLPALLGLSPTGGVVLTLGAALAFGGWALSHAGFRASRKLVWSGAAIGVCIVAGWAITGIVAFDPFDTRRVESFTFVAPLGETILYAMLMTGLGIDFPVGTVLGTIAGSWLAALWAKEFHWEAPDDAHEVKRHIFGAFLMGTGGVAALGCTIGQGVTGVSTLALGSFLAIAAMFAGARIGLYWLVERH